MRSVEFDSLGNIKNYVTTRTSSKGSVKSTGMPSLKKMNFLKNLGVPWGPEKWSKKQKMPHNDSSDKENVSNS
jgi:hypothetical protein